MVPPSPGEAIPYEKVTPPVEDIPYKMASPEQVIPYQN